MSNCKKTILNLKNDFIKLRIRANSKNVYTNKKIRIE